MNIGNFLAAAARSFAERPAISFGIDPYASYGKFFTRVSRLAGAYRNRLHLQPGDRVALAMKNCPQYLEAMYAVWHAGLCAVPMNAKLHPREFAYILENAGARVCFVTSDLANELSQLVSEIACLERMICIEESEYEQLIGSDCIDVHSVDPEDPAWLFYTSGTTGKPKGAILWHRALVGMTLRYYADIDKITDADCMLHAAPLSHGSGLYSLPHIAQASHQVIPAS